MKNTVIITIVVAILVGALGFYGGVQYQKSSAPKVTQGPGGNGQFAGRQFGAGTGVGRGANGTGITSGQILSKDDRSITIQLRDGGSKLVFLSDSTQVMKSAIGTTQDLTVGENVTANGTANPDGTINATTVQIRPAMPTDQAPQGNQPANTNQSAPVNSTK
jgi:hypothetical protein